LKATKEWGRIWNIILPSVNHALNLGMEKKYKQLHLKINRLVATQTEKPKTKTQFYPRVINKTDITFTDVEMILLNKGLKYNLNYRNKDRLSTLALEAETAILLFPPTNKNTYDTRSPTTFRSYRNSKTVNTQPETSGMKTNLSHKLEKR
jgi:hypothetical protein